MKIVFLIRKGFHNETGNIMQGLAYKYGSIRVDFDNKNIMKGLVARNGNIEKNCVDEYSGFRYNWHCCEKFN